MWILSELTFVFILKAIFICYKVNFVPFKFIDEKLRYGHFTARKWPKSVFLGHFLAVTIFYLVIRFIFHFHNKQNDKIEIKYGKIVNVIINVN